ncbi:hypothetical protein Leryth_004078 [Lithospermum erythrorhizon]|nr:hypothetical protein Leryth_004078 [Lithospermum erythrorhizon]
MPFCSAVVLVLLKLGSFVIEQYTNPLLIANSCTSSELKSCSAQKIGDISFKLSLLVLILELVPLGT